MKQLLRRSLWAQCLWQPCAWPLHRGCCGQGGHTLWGQHIFHPVLWSDSRKKDFLWLRLCALMLSHVILKAAGKYPNLGWVAAITHDLLSVSFRWPLEQKKTVDSTGEDLQC